jgi:hypothetical protein
MVVGAGVVVGQALLHSESAWSELGKFGIGILIDATLIDSPDCSPLAEVQGIDLALCGVRSVKISADVHYLGRCLLVVSVLGLALRRQLFAVHVSAQLLVAHARKIARVARFKLLHIEAHELPAQLFCPDRRTSTYVAAACSNVRAGLTP